MPAKSKSQQRLMGMVYKYKTTGELPDSPSLADKIKKIAQGISKKDAKDFAKTKHKNKPEVVESMTFKQFLLSEANKKWPVSDQEIQKFWSHYMGKYSDDDMRALAAEEWSDKFTDKQIDSGEFDEFIDHAQEIFFKVHG